MSATALHSIRVDAWGGIGCELAKARPLTAVEVDILQVESMNMSRNLIDQIRRCYD
jgi:hypothetical protein